MVLNAFFQKFAGKRESAYDFMERLLTPELATFMASQTVAATRAQIKANLQLGQRAQAREASDRVLEVLDGYQLRAAEQAGFVQLLRAAILMESERFEEARVIYQSVVDGEIPVDDKALVLQAKGNISLIRKRLQTRLSTLDENAPHLTDFYVCVNCGHFRLFLSAPCESCLFRPNTDDSLAVSFMCCSSKMDFGSMIGISVRLRNGEKLTSIIGNLAESVRQSRSADWFNESAQYVKSSSDTRTTRLADFTSCPKCKTAYFGSMQDECACAAPLKLPPRQRLLICFDVLLHEIEDRWTLPREWASLEFVSVLIWARYFLFANRQVPDADLQRYIKDLLPKVGTLLDRQDRGFAKYAENGKPTIYAKTDSEEGIRMLTIYFTLFNGEFLAMEKHFKDCAL